MPWFYSSYADEQFLGATVIESENYMTVTLKAHHLKINPGGEVLTTEIPDEMIYKFPPEYRNRLLSKADLLSLDNCIRVDSAGNALEELEKTA